MEKLDSPVDDSLAGLIRQGRQRLAKFAHQWIMFVRWTNLLMLSWPVPLETLRPHVPGRLELDEFNGMGWISLVPFMAQDMRFRALPPIPGQSDFCELNLRTYVKHGPARGVYFLSLDCPSLLATFVGDSLFHLPFKHAEMSITRHGSQFRVESHRVIRPGDPAADFAATYTPSGEPTLPAQSTLEDFLTSRLLLFAVAPNGRLYSSAVSHAPWRLNPAEVSIEVNTMAEAIGLSLPTRRPHAVFAARTDSLVYPPAAVGE